MKSAMNIAGGVLAIVPMVVAVVAVVWFLPDTVATHFGFDGVVNAVGDKSTDYVIGGVMTGVNLLCWVSMLFTEKMMALGLVHGVNSPTTARAVLLGSIVFIDVVFMVIVGVQIATPL